MNHLRLLRHTEAHRRWRSYFSSASASLLSRNYYNGVKSRCGVAERRMAFGKYVSKSWRHRLERPAGWQRKSKSTISMQTTSPLNVSLPKFVLVIRILSVWQENSNGSKNGSGKLRLTRAAQWVEIVWKGNNITQLLLPRTKVFGHLKNRAFYSQNNGPFIVTNPQPLPMTFPCYNDSMRRLRNWFQKTI